MADFAFAGYDNFVLENKILSILSTKLDVNRYMTADNSLAETAGMVKKIHKYVGSGNVEDLARGEGNSEFLDASYTEEEYRVGRTQGAIRYYDDDVMTDPALIETKVKTLAESMVNDWTAKAIAEYAKTSNQAVFTDYKLANFADAIAKYANVYETQEGLFFLAAMDLVPTIRKALGEQLMYVEDYIRTGAIGSVLGVPIYTSKAVPSGLMFMATKDAVTAFIKKGVNVEQDRDVNTKLNRMFATRYAVIALTDESKCVACGKAQTTAATITTSTKGAKTIAGAATTGAKVEVYVNGVLNATVDAASNAYTANALNNLVAGDNIKVIAKVEGSLPSIATTVVAE